MLNQTTYNAILIVLIILQVGLAFYFFKKIFEKFKQIRKISQKIKELETNKCKGPHEWINVLVKGSKTHVCKTCYWCPSHNSFVKESYVKEAIYTEEFDAKYKKYMNEKMQAISQEYIIDFEKIVEIDKKISQAKQDFSMEQLKKMLEEITGVSEKGND